MTRRSLAIALALALSGAAALTPRAAAQGSAGADLSERQMRAARDLERDGQLDAARRAYRALAEAETTPPALATEAFVAAGRLACPLEAVAQIGKVSVDPRGAADARAMYETVVQKFRGIDSASEAFWRLALIHLDPSAGAFDPARSQELLTTLASLYPRSPRAPAALAARARMMLDSDLPARARELAFEVLANAGGDAAAADAWLTLGLAEVREGRIGDGLVSFSRARQKAQEQRDDALAQQALALSVLADRIAFSAARGARPLDISAADVVAVPVRVRKVVARPDGRLVVAGDQQILALGGGSVDAAEGAVAVTFDRWGRMWSGGGASISGPGLKISLPDKTNVVALAPAGAKGAWFVDDRNDRVQRVDSGGSVVATARLPERASPAAIAPADGNGVWVVDRRTPALLEFGEDGLPRRSIGLAAVAPDPLDVARDLLGNVYVLDGKGPGLVVFLPGGQVAFRQPLPTEGDAGIGRPAAMAVERTGAVAVYDARKKRLQWLR